MAMKSSSLDHWRSYFNSANSDIFEIIQHAIMVAASDSPKEFKLKRDKIAETLFSCKLSRCVGCDRVELADDKEHNDNDGVEVEAGVSKESKVNGSDISDDHRVMNVNHVSIGDAEALTDEIEKESQCVGEVLKIKEVLLKHEKEYDSVLFESLRRLQLMELNMDRLQATEIGKAVSSLRKHASKEVRQLARTLISDWKEVVDEWIKATTTAAIAASDGTPDSVNPSVVDNDEEGLPSPPMDEGAFFTQAGSIELSQFFDGIDDYGNPRQSGQFNKNHENVRKPCMDSHTIEKGIMQASNATSITNKDSPSHQTKKNEGSVRLNNPLTNESGLGKPPKSSMQRKSNAEPKMHQKVDNNTLAKKPPIGQPDKFKYSDDAAEEVRLEAAKRKLQACYQQVENAKRKRTIQVMELSDLPKQAGVRRNPHFKPGNRNRQWGTQARR